MKQTPTNDHATHDQGDAPAVGSHMLERVSVYEGTGQLLSALAATATEHAQRHPEDEGAAQAAKIVTAIEIAHREGDPDSQAWIKKLAAKADHYMRREPLRGPRTREQQAKMLCSSVAYGLNGAWDDRQIADRLVLLVRVAPDIAQHTRVPTPAQVCGDEWRGSASEAEAVFAVESVVAQKRACHGDKAIKRAEAITKAALRALGCPNETVQNLFRT